MSEFEIPSPSGKAMLGELPDFLWPVLEMRVIMQTEGERFDRLQDELADQFEQRFADTATWDLPQWEEELGIVPPAGQPLQQRRAVVRSKMRGFGKFTGRLLKSVAGAYDNGTIHVSFDPASSTFTIRFVSTLGLPPNIEDLKKAVEDIMPAHLLVQYMYRYLTIAEIEGMTIAEIEATSLDRFAGGGA